MTHRLTYHYAIQGGSTLGGVRNRRAALNRADDSCRLVGPARPEHAWSANFGPIDLKTNCAVDGAVALATPLDLFTRPPRRKTRLVGLKV